MENKKWKLIGSAPSCNELRALIMEKLYWSDVVFDLVTGEVKNSKGTVEGLRIVKAQGRYRLEREVES